MREFGARTHQPDEARLVRDFAPALIDVAATPVRLEQWDVQGRPVYRIIGIVWGGSTPVDALQIRFRTGEPWTDITDRPTAADAASLVEDLMRRFIDGSLDAVYVVYAQFRSALSTPPATQQVLPVTPPKRTGVAPDYLLFPSAEEILTELLPSYVRNTVYRTLVETAAAEHGARRTAMKNATDNAGEILGKLTITYNRARQAQITQELAEIVGGAAALAG